MLKHFTLMRKINRRQINFFAADIIPYIEFRPVTDWEYANVLPFMNTTIVNVPEFRALQFWIPLSELIANRKDAFFRAGFLFITTGTADAGVELELFDGV